MMLKNLTSKEAFKLIEAMTNAFLIDVRTSKEWKEVGLVKLTEQGKTILISWRFLPDMLKNEYFIEELAEFVKPESHLFFLCRSGGRSYEAASLAIESNYLNCYNISDGFEGSVNGLGWKYSNLPWQI